MISKEKSYRKFSKTYEEWIASELRNLGLDKAICPHCKNDDQSLMRENWYFTHGQHKALNYQCHNRPTCDKYFQIGPLYECPCGWNRDEADLQRLMSKEWCYEPGGWVYREINRSSK